MSGRLENVIVIKVGIKLQLTYVLAHLHQKDTTISDCNVQTLDKPVTLEVATGRLECRNDDMAIATQFCQSYSQSIGKHHDVFLHCGCRRRTYLKQSSTTVGRFTLHSRSATVSKHDSSCRYSKFGCESNSKEYAIEYQTASCRRDVVTAVTLSLRFMSESSQWIIRPELRVTNRIILDTSPMIRLIDLAWRQCRPTHISAGLSHLLVRSMERLFSEGKAAPNDIDVTSENTYVHELISHDFSMHDLDTFTRLMQTLIRNGVSPIAYNRNAQ